MQRTRKDGGGSFALATCRNAKVKSKDEEKEVRAKCTKIKGCEVCNTDDELFEFLAVKENQLIQLCFVSFNGLLIS